MRLLSLLLVSFISLPATFVAAQIPYAEATPEQVQREMLSIHNSYRAQFNIKPIFWDDALASDAARYLLLHAKGGELLPSPENSRQGFGENVHRASAGALRPYAMAETWASERFNLRLGKFPDVSQTGNVADVEHYTQMIWEGTRRIGCATRRVRGFDYLLCRYSPPGNVSGTPVP